MNDMSLEKAREQVDKFKHYCGATKIELDCRYQALTEAALGNLIDRLLEIRKPNVKFKIDGKVIPLFAMAEDKFLGKENGKHIVVEYKEIEDHGRMLFAGMVCTGLSGDGCPSDAEYVFDENDDLQNKRFLDDVGMDELPF